jgi:hypothetical protein
MTELEVKTTWLAVVNAIPTLFLSNHSQLEAIVTPQMYAIV